MTRVATFGAKMTEKTILSGTSFGRVEFPASSVTVALSTTTTPTSSAATIAFIAIFVTTTVPNPSPRLDRGHPWVDRQMEREGYVNHAPGETNPVNGPTSSDFTIHYEHIAKVNTLEDKLSLIVEELNQNAQVRVVRSFRSFDLTFPRCI